MIGSFLVDVLMQNPSKSYDVYICGRNEMQALKRFESYCNDSSFHFFRQDLTENLQTDTHFHTIIHGAGLSYPAAFASDPVGTLTGTIIGTRNLLSHAVQHATERFLYISSGEVYGDGQGNTWKEHDSGYVDVLSARACYPTAKRAAENLCIAYSSQYGLNVSIARPSHIYGPTFTACDNRAYAQFFRNALLRQNIILKSDGTQRRSYCHVADCVSGLLHILFYGSCCQAYNIANNNSFITIRELAEKIATASGLEVSVQKAAEAEKRGYSTLSVTHLDTTLIESLNWNTQIDIDQGIASTLEILERQKVAK